VLALSTVSALRDSIVAAVRNIWATLFALGTTTLFQISLLPAVGTGTHLAAHEVAGTLDSVTNDLCLAPLLATGAQVARTSSHMQEVSVSADVATSRELGAHNIFWRLA
jgi:hypothetical protein